jgi:uncharacterized membrane protein
MSLFIFAGAVIRQYFVLRHSGKNQLALPLAGVVLLLCAAWLTGPSSRPGVESTRGEGSAETPIASASSAGNMAISGSPDIRAIQAIMTARCVQCHAATPSQAGFASAPLGIRLDSTDQTTLHAAQIKQAVASRYMPLGNMTQMTDAERAAIAAWRVQP